MKTSVKVEKRERQGRLHLNVRKVLDQLSKGHRLCLTASFVALILTLAGHCCMLKDAANELA
ncbi:MAG: hypothetical protein V2I33_25270, partial [Kangiellaceae bacterium]|nr:hypothetical protein [Kangiellaceae bacterium]